LLSFLEILLIYEFAGSDNIGFYIKARVVSLFRLLRFSYNNLLKCFQSIFFEATGKDYFL